jgi:hypothetical protein
MTEEQAVAYCCAPSIAWVKDANLTLLVDTETGRSWSISDDESTIWDLVVLGYKWRGIVRFLSVLSSLSGAEAEARLSDTVQRWVEQGLMCPVEGGGRG